MGSHRGQQADARVPGGKRKVPLPMAISGAQQPQLTEDSRSGMFNGRNGQNNLLRSRPDGSQARRISVTGGFTNHN